jgi:hypothetical protein
MFSVAQGQTAGVPTKLKIVSWRGFRLTDVRYWHLADILTETVNVSSWM